MPTVLDTRSADDPRNAIHQAVRELSDGNLVALPTETSYVVAAHVLAPEAIDKLIELVRNATHDTANASEFAIAIPGSEVAFEYIPEMSPLGTRLIRRGWPGPLTFVFPSSPKAETINSWPASIRERIVPDEIRLRVPSNDVLQQILGQPLE